MILVILCLFLLIGCTENPVTSDEDTNLVTPVTADSLIDDFSENDLSYYAQWTGGSEKCLAEFSYNSEGHIVF